MNGTALQMYILYYILYKQTEQYLYLFLTKRQKQPRLVIVRALSFTCVAGLCCLCRDSSYWKYWETQLLISAHRISTKRIEMYYKLWSEWVICTEIAYVNFNGVSWEGKELQSNLHKIWCLQKHFDSFRLHKKNGNIKIWKEHFKRNAFLV